MGLNSNLHVCFSKMVKDNFSELDTVNFVLVDKVELYAFCRSVKLGEIDQVPNLKAKLQLSESDLNPSPLKSVKNADPHGSRRSAWMISRTFKSNTFEVEMLGKFNHNPGSLVIGCVPFIPFLLPRAQKILGFFELTQNVVLGGHASGLKEVISLKLSCHLSNCIHHRLLLLLASSDSS